MDTVSAGRSLGGSQQIMLMREGQSSVSLLTVTQVAKELGMSEGQVVTVIRFGLMRHLYIGRHLRVTQQALKDYRAIQREAKRRASANHQSARKRLIRMQRTPMWSDPSEITKIYEAAATLSRTTGLRYHVDHIVPLKGKTVSGLHVPANLQILPAADNIRKHNRFEDAA